MRKLFLFIMILNLLAACQSAKDALTLKKRNTSDEFLVEKKNPLVLPPIYGDLPLPENESKIIEENNSEDIQAKLKKSKIIKNENLKNSKPSTIEKSVLKKIK